MSNETPKLTRYVVNVNVIIEASNEDEACAMLERQLAGFADYDVVDVFAEDVEARS